MSALQVLLHARERLVAEGWCQGEFVDEEGRRCIEGALMLPLPDDDSSYLAARRLLLRAAGGLYDSLVVWNDAYDRTEAEIRAALDAAINLARTEVV